MLLALDDGLFSQNATFADICFLIAAIVFIIALIVQLRLRVSLEFALVTTGFIALAIGWLVL
jgi:hypothetical protein